MSEPLTTKQKIAQLHKELDDITPAENLAIAREIIVELEGINSGLRDDNARLREELKQANDTLDHFGREKFKRISEALEAVR